MLVECITTPGGPVSAIDGILLVLADQKLRFDARSGSSQLLQAIVPWGAGPDPTFVRLQQPSGRGSKAVEYGFGLPSRVFAGRFDQRFNPKSGEEKSPLFELCIQLGEKKRAHNRTQWTAERDPLAIFPIPSTPLCTAPQGLRDSVATKARF